MRFPRAPRTAALLAAAATLSLAACDRGPETSLAPRAAPTGPTRSITAAPVTPVATVGIGQAHGCALRWDGTGTCWGDDSYGQTQPGVGMTGVARLAVGHNFTCALRTTGAVDCWGDASRGATTVPAGLSNVVQLSAGLGHACALVAGGTVTCWGRDDFGQASVPPGLTGVAQVAAGAFTTCALRTDGTTTCWGSTASIPATAPAAAAGATFVGVGVAHACALLPAGTLACWGGTGADDPSLAVPAGLGAVTQLGVNNHHACARTAAATVACWGETPASGTPYLAQQVPAGLAGVAQVQTGTYRSCAVLMSGAVTCWGDDYAGSATPPAGLVLFAPQAIAFTSPVPNGLAVGATYAVAATGGGSASMVTFASATPATCAVSGTTVTLLAMGTCTIAADQAGDGVRWQPAPTATQSATVLGTQAIGFTTPAPNPGYVGTSYSVAASGGASGNAVTFGTATPAVCTVAGNAVRLVAPGMCTVTADQAAGGSYVAAPRATQSFLVTQAAQAITFVSTPPSPAVLGTSYAVEATGGSSGNPVVVSSLTPTTCTVAGGTVTFVAVGACTIAANQAGNTAYLAAPQATQATSVVYPWTGFLAPTLASPALNAVRPGSTVSVAFTLGGDRGPAIVAAGSPTTVALPGCGATPSSVETPAVVPNRTLTYDRKSGAYTLAFTSDRAWDGTCRQLVVRLVDGTEHRASFRFAK